MSHPPVTTINQVSIRHRFSDSASIDLSFELPTTGVLGIFGPSGSGKTSLLRVVAGLLDADHAEVRFRQTVWQETGTFVPAHKRRIGYVFQESSLFPHLSVQENIQYAIERSGDSRIDMDSVIQIGRAHV